MRSTLRRFLLIAFIAGLSLFAAAQDSAKVFVYCPWEAPRHARITISLDDAPMAEIQSGRFFVINVKPGKHMLVAGEGVPLAIEPHAGQDLFVLLARDIEVGPSGQSEVPMLAVIAAEQARHEMVNLVYISSKKILSDSVSEQDPSVKEKPKLKTRD